MARCCQSTAAAWCADALAPSHLSSAGPARACHGMPIRGDTPSTPESIATCACCIRARSHFGPYSENKLLKRELLALSGRALEAILILYFPVHPATRGGMPWAASGGQPWAGKTGLHAHSTPPMALHTPSSERTMPAPGHRQKMPSTALGCGTLTGAVHRPHWP